MTREDKHERRQMRHQLQAFAEGFMPLNPIVQIPNVDEPRRTITDGNDFQLALLNYFANRPSTDGEIFRRSFESYKSSFRGRNG